MTTTRTLTANAHGPLTFAIKAELASAHVTVGAVSTAEVILSTDDPADGPAADCIRKATISRTHQGVQVEVPEPAGGTGITVVSNGRNSVSVVGGNISSSMVVSGGDVWVNGVRVQHGAHGGVISTGIRAVIRLPRTSSLVIRTSNSQYAVNGEELTSVDFTSHNGSLALGVPCQELTFDAHNGSLDSKAPVAQLDATTHNGDIHVDELHGNGKARAHNGNITLVAKAAGRVTARAHNGNVTVLDPLGLVSSGVLHVDADARNGRVRSPR